jgi:hypothetical protein
LEGQLLGEVFGIFASARHVQEKATGGQMVGFEQLIWFGLHASSRTA